MTRVRALRTLLSVGALASAALPLSLCAQLAVRGATACFAEAQPGSGRSLDALDRLERAVKAAEGRPGDDGALLASLAFAQQRAGCRAAFAATAERALRANPPAADAARLRALLTVARAQDADSVPVTGLALAVDDSVREGTLADLAWSQYRAGRFADAAGAFGQLAAIAPSTGARVDAQLLRAQALLEAGQAEDAARQFQAAGDDARRLGGVLANAGKPGVLDTLAGALARERAAGLLWATDVRDGRVFVPEDERGERSAAFNGARAAGGVGDAGAAAGRLRAVQAADMASWLAATGAASDPLARELIWVRAPLAPLPPSASRAPLAPPAPGASLAPLRVAIDSLSLLDVRATRAQARIDSIRGERGERIADAARFKARVAGFADSLAFTERQVAAFADSLVRRDSAIARTTSQYRATLLDKIATVRALAAQNRARIDSVASATRTLAGTSAPLVQYEQGTAASYVATADQAAGALDAGLTRLAVIYQRDTVRMKHAALRRSLAEARAAWDSAFAKASAAEAGVAAAEDKRLADATAELRGADAERRVAESRVASAAAAVLAARALVQRAAMDRAVEAADYGGGAASFFVALGADTARADPALAGARRTAATSALTGAITAHPASPLRARALMGLGELYTRKADADYAAQQRANANVDHPDYSAAIARYDTLLRDFPRDPEADAAAYTLGTIAFLSQRWDDALRAMDRVTAQEGSHYRAEAFFRQGDTRFEVATKLSGDTRRATFAQAAQSYERAIALAPADGDIYYLALYKLGWSNYVQAERQSSDEYRRAVDVFARLVREVDRLPKERQARLALRQEAIDYLAIAITQLGGAEEAVRYLAAIPDAETRLLVLRRVARALRDQGEFTNAVIAFRAAIDEAPNDGLTLDTRLEMVDLFQNRMLEPARAQQARLELADATEPGSPWARANAARAADAAVARERVLRASGAFALAEAKKPANRAQAPALFASAAELLGRYLKEFAKADSAQRASALEAEALFGAGDWFRAGVSFSRTATQWKGDSALAAVARRNAIVAFDSALAHERMQLTSPDPRRATLDPGRSTLDSLFVTSDRFAVLASDADARSATIAKGRRAAEGQRWDVVATTFEGFSARWPSDPFTAEARKLVGDARYRQGWYVDAQREWQAAQSLAVQGGRKALADSIVSTRLAAASQAADSLVKAGKYEQAADSIFAGIAASIGDPTRAADAMRNAVEVHLQADSVARAKSDTAGSRLARTHAVAAIEKLAAGYSTYQHTLAYAALRAQLLSGLGRPAESVEALEALIQSVPQWTGRADAMVRVAALEDSLGRRAEAARAYERFSSAYPNDKRAADAQYNAAVTFAEAKDAAASARSYAAFVQRFPRDARVGAAQRSRVEQLKAAGDEGTATAELAKLCVKPGEAMAQTCAERAGAQAYRDGMALWDRYVAVKLEIATKAQLNQAGVAQASAGKQQALRTMNAHFTRAIASGASEWVAAASYQSALAQWLYGIFLRDVVLPADLTDAQREAAKKGSATQAQAYFDAAVKGWQALVQKALDGKFENSWVEKGRAAVKGEGLP